MIDTHENKLFTVSYSLGQDFLNWAQLSTDSLWKIFRHAMKYWNFQSIIEKKKLAAIACLNQYHWAADWKLVLRLSINEKEFQRLIATGNSKRVRLRKIDSKVDLTPWIVHKKFKNLYFWMYHFYRNKRRSLGSMWYAMQLNFNQRPFCQLFKN